ncbi:catalase family peroxidase [Microbulbifer hainanensis]|uniref:catalase family peroxidase n=1 Tax=Microbulbifer hainanensis TaxID=2735675 RepID=UPI001865D902|nr:catalase family peroxidase [Microbulbifer hainanensis]
MTLSKQRARWLLVALPVVALGAAFAYVAGALAPDRLTPTTYVRQLEANAGVHPGYRRNHAKGLCVDGYFDSSGAAAALSSAAVFAPGRTPVVGRFSIPGGNPLASDGKALVRSLALQFTADDGQQWRMAMISSPVFVVSRPEAFIELLRAQAPTAASGKPDPARVSAFFAQHPETAAFRAWAGSHTPSDSFANTQYNSLNSFFLINDHGRRQAVRWSFVPQTPFAPGAADAGDDFLFDDIAARLAQGPLRWQLVLQLARPGDPVDDATHAWPASNPHIGAGTLVLTGGAPRAEGACRDINFDPLIVPQGVVPSADPLLAARSAVYARSFDKRIGEQAQAEGQQ